MKFNLNLINYVDLFKNLFENKVSLKKSRENFTGGFICVVLLGNINYNYTIENQIRKNTSIIEIEFSKIFADSESNIKKLENNYVQFIQNQKLALEDYLKDYE